MLGFETILNKVSSHADSLGVFDSVQTYESVLGPDSSVSCNIWLNDIVTIQSSNLISTSVCMTFNVSIMAPLLSEPYEETDNRMAQCLDVLMAAYNGDFTLDDTIRNVDILGEASQGITVTAGYAAIDSTKYRVLMVSLPLLVDSVWTQES